MLWTARAGGRDTAPTHANGHARPTDRVADDVAEARAGAPGEEPFGSDVAQAMRGAGKLGASLLATWAVALAVRVILPRHLGPASFGTFQFVDGLTTALFAAAGLGIDTYVRKEITTRRDHASQFFGGTLLVRLALSAVLMAVAVYGLAAMGRPASVLRLTVILGLAQVLVNVSATYAALLHAAGAVNGLSVLNVVAKVAWGLGVVGAVLLGSGVQSIAAMMLGAELLRVAVLAVLAKRHLALRFTIDIRAAAAVIVASSPFFLNAIALVAYSRIDMSVMSFLTSDTEVGWYGAAASLAGISLLLAPVIGWVLLPLSARAAARSDEELTTLTRRAMELVLVLAAPPVVLLALGAEEIVATVLGAPFAPAAASLRILAPTFIFTYVSMVSSSILVRLGRGWALTWISLSSMVLDAALCFYLVPRGLAAFGPGGAGVGAATALVLTELVAAASMTWILGRRAFDRRTVVAVVKTCLVCAAVVAADRLLAFMGAWRLLVDGALYAVLVLATGAVDRRATLDLARSALRRETPALAGAS